MLYPKNAEPFCEETFKNPSSEYRATPFWAWNSKLDEKELTEQIENFKKMGYGGFHMHVRTGMDTVYLSDDFFKLCNACVSKAKQQKMLAWLYDEDRWPSGAGGGYVTKEKKFRQRHLIFSLKAPTDPDDTLLAAYDIVFDNDGYMTDYKRIDKDAKAQGIKRYAYISIEKPGNGWFNNQCYIDMLNPEAVKRFIEVTHEAYKSHLGNEFSKTVPAIFTDEPQTAWQTPAVNHTDENDLSLPWTDKYVEKFKEHYGVDILDSLPEIFYERADKTLSLTRYRFHEFTMETFASGFADQCGKWCKKNNLALTGHVMNEQSLMQQTFSVGDAMRMYREFGIPGIDMLLDNHEYTTAKQTQSMVRQNGNEGMLCELDGVTNWDFDFRHHKHHGDWQAALGVSVRVPHLAWYSMNGEAKRDYPASISYQAAYASKYHVIEDYFGRIASTLTRGKAQCRVAMLHPVRSLWMYFGCDEQTREKRIAMDYGYFVPLCRELLVNQIDFDYISESNLPFQTYKNVTAPLCVGKMKYDAVIVPNVTVLCDSTVKILTDFAKAGGNVIFVGECPKYIDGAISDKAQELFSLSEQIDTSFESIVKSVEKYRDIEILSDGKRSNDYIYQLRKDGDDNWLFVSKADSPEFDHKIEKDENNHYHESWSTFDYPNGIDSIKSDDITLKIKGEYFVTVYDALTGERFCPKYEQKDGYTYVYDKMYIYDSLLLRLTKKNTGVTEKQIKPVNVKGTSYNNAAYTLSEPNVLLLDEAEFKLDDGEWQEKDEILRIDNICRKMLGWKSRSEGIPQPWVINDETVTNLLTLKYTFNSKIDYADAVLALEMLDNGIKIEFNGNKCDTTVLGWYVDKCIKKVKIGSIKKGENELIVYFPYFVKANPESMYLLGDFGVYDDNGKPYIDSLPKKLDFYDIAKQGLMFYGGNVTYSLPVTVTNKQIDIYLPQMRCAAAEILLDGKYVGDIVTAPYSLHIPNVENGVHTISVTIVGTRVNTFGQLHKGWHEHFELIGNKSTEIYKLSGNPVWWGPGSWRTEGSDWTYSYNTWIQGLLKPPVIDC